MDKALALFKMVNDGADPIVTADDAQYDEFYTAGWICPECGSKVYLRKGHTRKRRKIRFEAKEWNVRGYFYHSSHSTVSCSLRVLSEGDFITHRLNPQLSPANRGQRIEIFNALMLDLMLENPQSELSKGGIKDSFGEAPTGKALKFIGEMEKLGALDAVADLIFKLVQQDTFMSTLRIQLALTDLLNEKIPQRKALDWDMEVITDWLNHFDFELDGAAYPTNVEQSESWVQAKRLSNMPIEYLSIQLCMPQHLLGVQHAISAEAINWLRSGSSAGFIQNIVKRAPFGMLEQLAAGLFLTFGVYCNENNEVINRGNEHLSQSLRTDLLEHPGFADLNQEINSRADLYSQYRAKDIASQNNSLFVERHNLDFINELAFLAHTTAHVLMTAIPFTPWAVVLDPDNVRRLLKRHRKRSLKTGKGVKGFESR